MGQKKSLETDIEKQKAEEIKINDELLSLEKNANNFDSNTLEAQKAEIFSELYGLSKTTTFIDKYIAINTYTDPNIHPDL